MQRCQRDAEEVQKQQCFRMKLSLPALQDTHTIYKQLSSTALCAQQKGEGSAMEQFPGSSSHINKSSLEGKKTLGWSTLYRAQSAVNRDTKSKAL